MFVAVLTIVGIFVWDFIYRHFSALPSDFHLTWPVIAALYFISERFIVDLDVREQTHSFSLSEIALVLGLVAAPLANGFSRLIERQADDFALALTRNPGGFIGAMERLASLNLAERRPHRLKELVLYSHPALDRRIARARAAL